MARRSRLVRSARACEREAELVLEPCAPAQLFDADDDTVFSPLTRSSAPQPAAVA